MTTSQQRCDTDPSAHVRAVADEVGRLVRLLKAWRSAMTDPRRYPQGAAHLLLLTLDTHGRMRTTALADCTHTDPSTISRHVSLLLNEGLVERQADQTDGRASLLALTDHGRERVAEMRRSRDAMVTGLLADWPRDEVEIFARLLNRFNAHVDGALPGAHQDQEIA